MVQIEFALLLSKNVYEVLDQVSRARRQSIDQLLTEEMPCLLDTLIDRLYTTANPLREELYAKLDQH